MDDIKSEVDIHTSQQKVGEISDPGGKDSGPGPGPNVYGDEMAPTGVNTQRQGEDQLLTSQQLRKEHKKLDSSFD
jgi:hypothetical protein